jgi:hypothetical protein
MKIKMKMKLRIVARLALIMFTGIVNLCIYTACKEENLEQSKPTLKLNKEEILVEDDTATVVTFDINSNADWKVLSYNDWLHVSPETGNGKSTINVTVGENNEGEARTGKVEVVAGSIKESVSISQSKTINLVLTSKEVALKDLDNGDQVTFKVTSDVDWVLESASDWFTVTPEKGRGGRTVEVTVAAGMNITPGARNGEIVFKTATRSATCLVSQNRGEDRFSLGSNRIDISDIGKYRLLRVVSSTQWTVTGDDWLQAEPATGIGSQVIKISASANTSETEERTGTLTFSSGNTVSVVQGRAGDYLNNKQVVPLYTHTVGKGVPVVIIGDGFDRVDNKKGGIFDSVSRELADSLLLRNYIVMDFADMFDVYAVVVESPETGVVRGTQTMFDTPTGVNFGAARQFAHDAFAQQEGKDLPPTVSYIFVGHGMIGGYAYFGDGVGEGIGVFSTAEGVNMYWMSHEFTGHGFASLADEYVNPGYMGGIQDLKNYQSRYMCMNCSVTTDPKLAPWGRFIGLEGYEEVSFYEGGFYEAKDIWRPEETSVMVTLGPNGEIYYNAQSRWLIYERIHKVAGVDYSFESFLEFDKKYNTK